MYTPLVPYFPNCPFPSTPFCYLSPFFIFNILSKKKPPNTYPYLPIPYSYLSLIPLSP